MTAPAAEGSGEIVNVMVDVTVVGLAGEHVKSVALRVRVVLPVSVRPGVYIGFNTVVLEKVPVPVDVQSRVAVFEVAVLRVYVWPWQIVAFDPAETVIGQVAAA